MDANAGRPRADRLSSNGVLFAAAFLVGFVAALAATYLLALVPVPAIDRFSMIALALPVVWVCVCLHVLLVMRPYRLGLVYLAIAIGASVLALAG